MIERNEEKKGRTAMIASFVRWWRDQVKAPLTDLSARIAQDELAREAFFAGWKAHPSIDVKAVAERIADAYGETWIDLDDLKTVIADELARALAADRTEGDQTR